MSSLLMLLWILHAMFCCDWACWAQISYTGHYYVIFDESLDWSDAATTCKNDNGYLLSLNDATEQAVLLGYVQQNHNSDLKTTWLGFRVASTTDMSGHRNTAWEDGSQVTYVDWNPDFPDLSQIMGEYSYPSWNFLNDGWQNGAGAAKIEGSYICEYLNPCRSAFVACTSTSVCVQDTATTEHACVCFSGFSGPDCTIPPDGTVTTAAEESDNEDEASESDEALGARVRAFLGDYSMMEIIIFVAVTSACIALVCACVVMYTRMRRRQGREGAGAAGRARKSSVRSRASRASSAASSRRSSVSRRSSDVYSMGDIPKFIFVTPSHEKNLVLPSPTPSPQANTPTPPATPPPPVAPTNQYVPPPVPRASPVPPPSPPPPPVPQAQVQAYPVAQPQARQVAQPQAYPVAQAQGYPVAQPQGYPVAQPQARPVAQPQAYPVAQPQGYPVAQPQAYPVAQPQARPVAQPQAPVATWKQTGRKYNIT